VLYAADLVDRPGDLNEALQDARALIVRNRTQVNPEMLARAPALQAVGRLGVGLDNIDLVACSAQGVTVYPATGANDIAVAEYVIATVMLLARNAYGASQEVISGKWPRQSCIGREIRGQVLGLVGCGEIARETARLAQALGMTAIAYDPYVDVGDSVWEKIERSESLQELFAAADVISLHVPLNDSTRSLIGAEALSGAKPGALLVNTSRGGVVDEAALVAALKGGLLGGAAIDVFASEPLGEASGQQFAGIPNLILTPHIAGVTEQSNVRVSSMIADTVAQHLSVAS
jgi:(S)-sulfolactate dehydrogenase